MSLSAKIVAIIVLMCVYADWDRIESGLRSTASSAYEWLPSVDVKVCR